MAIGRGFETTPLILDGVMYVAEDPIPGAIEKVLDLRERGIHVVFCTNNSRPTSGAAAAK